MNPILTYQNENLHIGKASLDEIAQKYGTPSYVYHAPTIKKNLEEYQRALQGQKSLVCYAVKANSNLSVLRIVAKAGAGADIVSGGELARALKAGICAQKIVFSGVGKTETEIKAALKADILFFSVESKSELRHIARIADSLNRKAAISLRVNPNVDAGTHPYISTGLTENKFGIAHEQILPLYEEALQLSSLEPCGIGFHIGSQLTSLDGYKAAAERLRDMIAALQEMGVPLRYIDCGGGLGIDYNGETPPSSEQYISLMRKELPYPKYTLLFEPGRSIVGNAGILLSRVLYHKTNSKKFFLVCDAAMNDLIRPALYDGFHRILPFRKSANENQHKGDLVGPICESGDFLAKNRLLPDIREGELLAVDSAGAYGFVMASNYNSRPRPPEVLVEEDGSFRLIRKRETLEDLIAQEQLEQTNFESPYTS